MASVAVGQFAPTENTSDNIETVRLFASLARNDGASLLVLPEYSSYTAAKFDGRIGENAESLDGPFATAVREAAGEHSLAIVAGMIERSSDSSRVHNTLLMVDQDGELEATYRKVHLYDALGFQESEWIEPGRPTSTAVMDIEGLRFGAQTCYDLRFPEASRVLVDAGADVVIVPAQWVPGPMKEDHWITLLRARAIENAVYVAAAGQSAPGGCGASVIIDPMGAVMAGIGSGTGLASADVDRERIDQVRAANPVLASRRFHVVPNPEDPRSQ